MMNLRISPRSIRFRMSAEAFAELGRAGLLQGVTTLGAGQSLHYCIRCTALPGGRQLELASTSDAQGMQLTLSVSPEALAQLDAEAPSKEGIKDEQKDAAGATLSIGLEIDIRREKRR